MAYQKDTANTVEQVFDKFLAFCCLYGGYSRLPDSGTEKSITKGSVTYKFDTLFRTSNNNKLDKGSYISCKMTVNGTTQPLITTLALWMYQPPFVAIDMFANANDCYLIIELSNGVFTQLGIGKVVDLTGDVQGGFFLQANGMLEVNDISLNYQNCIGDSTMRSSFFGCPTSRDDTGINSRSYVFDGTFKETQRNNTTYFCGHNNPLTDSLIVRTPASNILRHTSPPLYYVDKNTVENTEYVKGYVYGCRPCRTDLLQFRDTIIDNWMMFPLTSINDNISQYPSCQGRGYLFYTGD